MKKLFSLFLTFFKIGLFTFGGGYAMLSLIEKEVVERHKWIASEEMLDMLAISESTPGAISLNIATYVGVRVKGILGSLFATLGLVLPSFIVISIVSVFITEFLEIKAISYAFRGIRVGVVVLIANAFVKFAKGMKKDLFSLILFVTAFLLAVFVTQLDIVFIILGAIVIGILFGYARKGILKKRSSKKSSRAKRNGFSAGGAAQGEEENTGIIKISETDHDSENADGICVEKETANRGDGQEGENTQIKNSSDLLKKRADELRDELFEGDKK